MGRGNKAPSNTEWRRWGDADPFFGVASWTGRQRGGTNPWTADDFYDLGRSDWIDFRDHWLRYGLRFGRVVEVGCGAGRLTNALAAAFTDVIGVDVSEGMLEVAHSNVLQANVNLRLGDGITLPVETASADAVLSTHVFQHFESFDLARANFAEVARVLTPGGTMLIHLPVMLPPVGLPGVDVALAVKRKLGDLKAAVQRRRGAPLMRGLQFPWTWLSRELPRLGLVDVELVMFATKSNGAYHACVLARRADRG